VGRYFAFYDIPRGRVTASGWDPAFCPDQPRTPADVVNFGYVLNVIEDPKKRSRVLAEPWGLATKLLVAAACECVMPGQFRAI